MAVGGLVKVWPNHVYVRVQGEIRNASTAAPVEQFSFGVRVGQVPRPNTTPATASELNDQGWTEAQLKTYLTSRVEPAVRSFMALNLISRFCAVTKISANRIVNDAGRAVYAYQNPNELYPGVTSGVTAIVGGSTLTDLNYHMVPQVACAVSTRTALQRGAGSKGRFYLPPFALTLGPNWRLSSTHATAVATAAAAFMQGLSWSPTINGSALVGLAPCIVSPSPQVGAGTPLGRVVPITQIRVGDVLDTIRSRREQMPEVYVGQAVTLPV